MGTEKGQFLFHSQRRASLVAQMVNGPPSMQKTQVPSLGGEDPPEKEMATILVFLPGKFHGAWCAAVHEVTKE